MKTDRARAWCGVPNIRELMGKQHSAADRLAVGRRWQRPAVPVIGFVSSSFLPADGVTQPMTSFQRRRRPANDLV
jgi:hypothetical protein